MWGEWWWRRTFYLSLLSYFFSWTGGLKNWYSRRNRRLCRLQDTWTTRTRGIVCVRRSYTLQQRRKEECRLVEKSISSTPVFVWATLLFPTPRMRRPFFSFFLNSGSPYLDSYLGTDNPAFQSPWNRKKSPLLDFCSWVHPPIAFWGRFRLYMYNFIGCIYFNYF